METLFKDSPQREVVIKWKGGTTKRLDDLIRQLQQQADNRCKFRKTNREDLAKIDEMKETHHRLILDQVKHLACEFEKGVLNDEELEESFNVKWNEWINDIRFEPMDEVNVKSEVEHCLTSYEQLRSSSSMVLAKLCSKSLKKC